MEEYKLTMHDEGDTVELAQNIESEKFPNMVICLYGDLGSGKTVFAKAFGHAMGIDGVTSSTFNIIKKNYLNENTDNIDVGNEIEIYSDNTNIFTGMIFDVKRDRFNCTCRVFADSRQ